MRRDGFTLIELLLALTLVALLAVLGGFELYRQFDRVALAGSVRRLLQVAGHARLLAAEHHRLCRVHIDLDRGTYWLTAEELGVAVEAETEARAEPIVAETYARPRQLGEKVWFESARVGQGPIRRTGRTEITFNVDGSAEAALVQVSNRHDTQTLLVYPWTGKVQLKKGAINELPSDAVRR